MGRRRGRSGGAVRLDDDGEIQRRSGGLEESTGIARGRGCQRWCRRVCVSWTCRSKKRRWTWVRGRGRWFECLCFFCSVRHHEYTQPHRLTFPSGTGAPARKPAAGRCGGGTLDAGCASCCQARFEASSSLPTLRLFISADTSRVFFSSDTPFLLTLRRPNTFNKSSRSSIPTHLSTASLSTRADWWTG